MNLDEIAAILGAIDPEIRHYWTMGTGRPYTWWAEKYRLDITADDRHTEDAWAFEVHRFAVDEDDPMPSAIFAALDSMPNVTVEWLNEREQDTDYIHHVFDCEVV